MTETKKSAIFDNREMSINDLILKGLKLSVERAIEVSIRTQTSLLVVINGKIAEVKPKYKYAFVPINSPKKTPISDFVNTSKLFEHSDQ
jgi:hypothetical protein